MVPKMVIQLSITIMKLDSAPVRYTNNYSEIAGTLNPNYTVSGGHTCIQDDTGTCQLRNDYTRAPTARIISN